jgi:hypothetical protein
MRTTMEKNVATEDDTESRRIAKGLFQWVIAEERSDKVRDLVRVRARSGGQGMNGKKERKN